jgi:predicted NodU family carbamoyl transferase
MIILGFSGIENGDFYHRHHGLRFVGHDAAVALVVDGRVMFAAEEERFTRDKHTSRLPVHALRAALSHAGITLRDVDRLAYTWRVSPAKYLHMCLRHMPCVPPRHSIAMALTGLRVVRDLMWPGHVARSLAAALGARVPQCTGIEHHLGHAATAYLPSPFSRAAVREAWRERLGAVQHHGRTRVQTVTPRSDPFFHELLLAFARRTGVPALLNTSFNDADEPIVCTARDALRCFLATGADALVLGSCFVTRR